MHSTRYAGLREKQNSASLLDIAPIKVVERIIQKMYLLYIIHGMQGLKPKRKKLHFKKVLFEIFNQHNFLSRQVEVVGQ